MPPSSVPASSMLHSDYLRHAPQDWTFQDCHSVLLARAGLTPDDLVPAFFRATSGLLDRLMRLRDAVVKVLGLKTTNIGDPARLSPPFPVGRRVGLFRVIARSDDEIILGEDDRHLDFRISILVERSSQTPDRLSVSTIVKPHNLGGRIYLAIVLPVHKLLVPVSVRRMARLLDTP